MEEPKRTQEQIWHTAKEHNILNIISTIDSYNVLGLVWL